MSQLTAHSVLPVVSALPEEEKRVLLQELQKMVTPQEPKKKKRKDVLDLPHMAKYRPENREMLIAEITGNL